MVHLTKISFKGGHMVNIGTGQNKKEGGFNTGDNGENLGVQPMLKSSDFPQAVAAALKTKLLTDTSTPVIWMALPGGAGTDKTGQFAVIPNVVGKEDHKPVGKVYISNIEREIKKYRPDAKLKVTNDGMMQAYQDMRNLKIKKFIEKLDEGESFIGKFGAGGCGGYTGQKTDQGVQVIPMEIGHTQIPKDEINPKYVLPEEIDKLTTIESYAGCAPAAIKNFALKLGFDPQKAKKLSQTVEGRMLTQNIIKLDKNDPEQSSQADALKATGLFTSTKKEGSEEEFQLIDPTTNKPITQERRVQGLKAAAEEYFKSMGIMLADGANHLSNTIILTAGFDSHLAKAAKKDAHINPKQIIKETAFRNVDSSRQDAIGKPKNFNVLIEDTGDPSDPENALLMSKGKIIGGYRIGIIPRETLI